MLDQLSQHASRAAEFAHQAASGLSAMLCGLETNLIPEHGGICWRIKTPDAIAAKVRARPVNDFIGIRVLVRHSGILADALQRIAAWAPQYCLEEKLSQDKYATPARGGYRAFHVDYEFYHDNRWGLPKEVTVELQLTTWMQNLHSEISHRLLYKNTSATSSLIITDLEEMSTLLYETDAHLATKYASLFRAS